MKKIFILLILILVLAGCGLENDIVTTMATGGLDEEGNIPESVSRLEGWYQERTVLGENLLLTWKVILSGSQADEEQFYLSNIFDEIEVELFQGNESEPFLTETVEVESYNRLYGKWINSPDFDPSESYSWRIRFTGSTGESDYHGAWYGPYSLDPESSTVLDSLESSGYGDFDYEFIGTSPALLADGDDVYAAFISDETEMTLQSSTTGGDWSSLDTAVVNGDGSYRQGDDIKILKDSTNVFHIMKASGGILEHFTWSSGETSLTLIQFDGEDNLEYESHHKPSMAIDGVGTVYFLYYPDASPYSLSIVSSADSFASPVVVDSDAGYYQQYGEHEGTAQLLIDSSGNLHAVYTSWEEISLFHSVSTDNGGSWTTPSIILDGDFAYGLGATLVGNTIYAAYAGPDSGTWEISERSLYWIEYTPGAGPADGTWSEPEEISEWVWDGDYSEKKAVSFIIKADSAGTPYLMAVIGTEDFSGVHTTDIEGVFPAPCVALFRKGVDSWEKHLLDTGTAHNYAENYNRDSIQLDFDIDSEDNLHFIFKEISDPLPADYNNEVAAYVKYVSLNLSELDFH